MTEEPTEQERAANDKLERLKKRIRTAADKIERVKIERSSKTAEINDARLGLEADGIPREALDMALKYAAWDSNKRRGFDRAYAIVREALDLEIENDLFSYKDGVLPQTPPKKAEAKAAPKAAAKAAESSPAKPASRPRNPPKVKPPTPAELAAGDTRKTPAQAVKDSAAASDKMLADQIAAQQAREQTEGAQLIDGKPVTH